MLPPMAELYDGQSIFITGASGFVGKALIEKLLRSLPGITTIFALIRPMKGLSGVARWQNIESTVLFNQIRMNFPERLRKVVVVEGDISEDDFGLDSESLARVLAETSVVFHCAAAVRFDERLKRAADMNIRGVRRMVELCHRMPKLEVFLHCSTTYANSDKQGEYIEEKIYPTRADAHKLLAALENLDDFEIELISAHLSRGYPNTYCFTKILGEQIVARDAADLPALIFRPSIISSVWQDGIPGWADAFQGLTAMLGAMYAGTIPRYPMLSVNPKGIMDCVPIDVVTSMMIVCAGHRMSFNTDSIPVYHCCTTDLNPLDMRILTHHGQKYAMQYPTEKFLSPPSFCLRGLNYIECLRHKFRAEILGPGMDGMAFVTRQKPMWTKIYGKMRSAYGALFPFAYYFHFESKSMIKLTEMLTDEDKKTFNFDVRKIDWRDYGCDLILGTKTFLLKDDIADYARIRRSKINLFSHQLLELLPIYALCCIIIELITLSSTAWHIFLPILLVVTIYSLKDWIVCTHIKSLEEYREEIEKVMGEPIRPKKQDAHVV